MSSKSVKKVEPEKRLAVTKEYIMTQKFKDWCKYYLDPTSTETYGNATRSALRVYNTESYHAAGNIGMENVKKLGDTYGKDVKLLKTMIADQNGFGLADMMKIGLKMMMEGEFDDWLKMMRELGYSNEEVKKDAGPTVNVQNIINDWGK